MTITRRQGLTGLAAGVAAIAMPTVARSQTPDIVIGAPNSVTGGLGELGSRAVWGLIEDRTAVSIWAICPIAP